MSMTETASCGCVIEHLHPGKRSIVSRCHTDTCAVDAADAEDAESSIQLEEEGEYDWYGYMQEDDEVLNQGFVVAGTA